MHKQRVPAVWFQNKLGPAPRAVTKPAMLELFEDQLARVTGGFIVTGTESYAGSPPVPNDTAD